MIGCMLDTNIFNNILDSSITVNDLPKNLSYYVTHLQRDEIENSHGDRKKDLLNIFREIKNEKVPTESAVVGVSRVDESKASEDNLYNSLLSRLQELDKKARKKNKPENQARDALIADTSIKNNLILVSSDINLRTVTQEFGGEVISFEQLQNGEF